MKNSGTWVEKIDCIHKKQLVNQGITMCDKGDPSKCNTCPFKEQEEIIHEWSSASTYSSRPVPHASPIYDPPRKRHKDKAKHKK